MRKIFVKAFCLILIYLLFLSLKTCNAEDTGYIGVTLYVDDDYLESTFGWGINHFDSMQAALSKAVIGDDIYVYSGYYSGGITLWGYDLTGEDKDTTFIDCNSDVGIIVKRGDAKITGFTIQNGENGINLASDNNHNPSIESKNKSPGFEMILVFAILGLLVVQKHKRRKK